MEMPELVTSSKGDSQKRWFITTLVVISALMVLPFIATPYLPLNDYPFHLARIVILSSLEQSSFSEFYSAGSLFLPNMAMDLLALPLAGIFGPELASRIFAALTLLSMLWGTFALHYSVHNRFSAWPLLAVASLFNGIFRFGFLNYLFGLGMALAAAGLIFRMRAGATKLVTTFFLSVLLTLLHFEAFAVFAIIAGSFELYATWKARDSGWINSFRHLVLSAIPFLLTIALFVAISPTAGDVNSGQFVLSFRPSWKVLGGLFSLLTLITWLDVLVLVLLMIILVIALCTRRLQLSFPMFFATVMLAAAYLVLPGSLMGSHFVDVRLGPAIALLLLASVDIKSPNSVLQKVTFSVALLLAGCISIGHWYNWQAYNGKISRIVSCFDKTEQNAVIFSATAEPFTRLIADSAERAAAWRPPLKHVSSYAVLSGPRFVPMTFADPNKQPMNILGQYQNIKVFQGDNPRKTFTADALLEFIDQIQLKRQGQSWPELPNVYVFVVGFDKLSDQLDMANLKQKLEIAYREDNFALLKLY